MSEKIEYFDGNWNAVDDEAHAVYRMITTTDANGIVTYRRRESLGERKGRRTYSTDPRAGAIMRDGQRVRPMSRPVD